VLTESTIREGLRLNPEMIRGLLREVAHPDGVVLPNGQHLPRGTQVGVCLNGIRTDEQFYVDLNQYNPFRFVKRGPGSPASDTAQSGADDSKIAGTNERFLPFGLGRHVW